MRFRRSLRRKAVHVDISVVTSKNCWDAKLLSRHQMAARARTAAERQAAHQRLRDSGHGSGLDVGRPSVTA
jgi:hypothetical protein